MNFLPPATKLGLGYVFTCVCDSVHRGVVSQHALQVISQHALQQVSRAGISACLAGFQAHTQGEVEGSGQGGLQAHTQGGVEGSGLGGLQAHTQGGVSQHALKQTPLMATAAGSMHPTGKHSCS